MASYFDLYGCSLEDVERARPHIELALDVKLVPRESGYLGEYYRFDYGGGEHIVLQKNHDDSENEWLEDRFKEYPVLLYVNKTKRPKEFEERLKSSEIKFDLLRREEI